MQRINLLIFILQEENGYEEAVAEMERLREEVKSLREEQGSKKEEKKKQEAALKESKSRQASLAQKNQALEAEVEVVFCLFF